MNRLHTGKRAQVISALVEGNSINAIVRMTGVAKQTLLLQDIGCIAAAYHDDRVRNIHARCVQVDEAWAFCYAKQKNIPQDKQGKFGYGDVWTDLLSVPRDVDWSGFREDMTIFTAAL